jgi:type III secretion system TyeA family effector delivery regulator
MGNLPIEVFPDAEARQGVLNAIQGALDMAIDAEDL